MAYTSANGSFTIDGYTGVVRDASINFARDTLETTGLGDYARTYKPGLIGNTGSATFLYDTSVKETLMFNILSTAESRNTPIRIALKIGNGEILSGNVFLTQVGTSMSVGEVTSTSVSFQFTGL